MMIVTHEWSAAVTGGSDDIISIMYHRHRHRLSSSLLPEAFVQVHDCLKNSRPPPNFEAVQRLKGMLCRTKKVWQYTPLLLCGACLCRCTWRQPGAHRNCVTAYSGAGAFHSPRLSDQKESGVDAGLKAYPEGAGMQDPRGVSCTG